MSSHTTEEERRRKIIIDSQVANVALRCIGVCAGDPDAPEAFTARQLSQLIALDEAYLLQFEEIMSPAGWLDKPVIDCVLAWMTEYHHLGSDAERQEMLAALQHSSGLRYDSRKKRAVTSWSHGGNGGNGEALGE